MYSIKKFDMIQVNLTGSGDYDEKSTYFFRNNSDRLWCLLFITTSWNHPYTPITGLECVTNHNWFCLLRAGLSSE